MDHCSATWIVFLVVPVRLQPPSNRPRKVDPISDGRGGCNRDQHGHAAIRTGSLVLFATTASGLSNPIDILSVQSVDEIAVAVKPPPKG